MSLFGTSPETAAQARPTPAQTSSLFDDEPASMSKSNNSLFAEETNTNGDSPWGMPTPKKAARSDIVKNLLRSADIPETYIDTFDALLDSGNREGSNLSSAGVTKLFEGSNIESSEQTRLQNIVAPGGIPSTGLDRSTFNVLLALVDLVQEGDDATLDGVDERRNSMTIISNLLVNALTGDRFTKGQVIELGIHQSF